jgi:hypothetical protein
MRAMSPRSSAAQRIEPATDIAAVGPEERITAVHGASNPLPLTTALIDASLLALSFATPGHRAGRSWSSVLDC